MSVCVTGYARARACQCASVFDCLLVIMSDCLNVCMCLSMFVCMCASISLSVGVLRPVWCCLSGCRLSAVWLPSAGYRLSGCQPVWLPDCVYCWPQGVSKTLLSLPLVHDDAAGSAGAGGQAHFAGGSGQEDEPPGES